MTNFSAIVGKTLESICESVGIEDICGDLQALVGSPLLQAEESTNRDNPPKNHDDCYLWTFYRMATFSASAVIRWYGESNGYYSVSVDFTMEN